MNEISIDLETYSENSIKLGSHKYAEKSEIMLFAYSINKSRPYVVDLLHGEEIPPHVVKAIFDPKFIKKAWNAAFEITQLSKYFGQKIDASQWRCTMVKAARAGYPLGLGDAAKALGLEEQKDTKGKALIKKFCEPKKPTAKSPSFRNYPTDSVDLWDDWEAFKSYAMQDVATEMAIDEALSVLPPFPAFEERMYALDRRINERGIELDLPYIEKIIRLDFEYKNRLTKEASEFTGLENPNSLHQIKAWCEDRGLFYDSLDKDALSQFMDGYKDSEDQAGQEIYKFLEFRKELSNTSVRKYIKMQEARVGTRIHDTIQFNGAARTGRNAGRLIQPQNLPRIYMNDAELDQAKKDVLAMELDELELKYPSISSLLSQLIRTALISAEGKILRAVDLSAIEARIVAWLADEKYDLEVFRTHGKIYEATASAMFKIPLSEITKESPYRQRGKVASLACIAKGSLVLTDIGLVPIEEVTTSHLLWDGVTWVGHEGVVYKGIKKTIEYAGLRATPDHIVWVEGSERPIPFGIAAQSGQNLLQSGSGREAIRVGENNIRRTSVYAKLVGPLRSNTMCRVSENRMDLLRQLNQRSFKRLPKLLYRAQTTPETYEEANLGKTKMCEPKRPQLSQLRRSWNQVPFRKYFGSRSLRPSTVGASFGSSPIHRPYRQQLPLHARELTLRKPFAVGGQQECFRTSRLEPSRMAVCPINNREVRSQRIVERSNTRESAGSCLYEAEELGGNPREVEVFDIVNAGPRNRFTVSDVLVHNCGYQGGANAITQMDTDRAIPDKDKPGLVKAWREAHPATVKYWRTIENAAKKAIKNPGEKIPLTKGSYFKFHAGHLLMFLPSGRYLTYPGAHLAEKMTSFGTSEEIRYYGIDQYTNKWKRLSTYGGKLLENQTQAIARDVLMVGMDNFDKHGYSIVTNVHDEIVTEDEIGFGSLEELEKLMCDMPSWTEGLPLGAEGFESKYYKK